MDANLREGICRLKVRLARSGALDLQDRLERDQYLSSDELAEQNWQKALQVLQFAYDHSPFYRQKYRDAGMVPQDVKHPEDWLSVPAVTREEIRENFAAVRVAGVGDASCTRVSTGGSSGVPLQVLHDRRVPIEAAGWRALRWWGCSPWDARAIVSRMTKTRWRRLLGDIVAWPRNLLVLDASLMTESSMRLFVRSFNALRPSLLEGYVGAMGELAHFVSRTGTRVFSPQAVLVTSAPLTESQRQYIQGIFQAPVYDQYGSCEFYWLAAECRERNGLHVFSDLRRLEFLRDDGSAADVGEIGDVLVTDLRNRVFPLVRYRMGDRGTWRKGICPCGVTLPLMEKIRGRVSDRLRFPDGRSIAGEYLTTIFNGSPMAVTNFQVFQHADGHVTLKCVLGSVPNGLSIAQATAKLLQTKAGNTASVQLEIVESIPHDRGKTRFVISEYPG